MDKNKIENLTENVIKTVYLEGKEEWTVVLQITEIKHPVEESRELIEMKLSDGFFFSSFIVDPRISKEIVKKINKLDVIETKVTKKQDQQKATLLSIKQIYTDINDFIGAPKEFDANNPDKMNQFGNNKIPQYVFLPLTQDTQNEEIILLEENDQDKDVVYNEIIELNPYMFFWEMKGRVVKKSDIVRFTHKGTESSVFSIVITDKTKSIQGVFFRDLVDKFFSFIKVGSVYSLRNGQIQNSGKYNRAKNNYEIIFNGRTSIKKHAENDSLPRFSFNFRKIDTILKLADDHYTDLLCVIHTVCELRSVHLKTGEEKKVRDVIVKDSSNHAIKFTIWGDDAVNLDSEKNDIILIQDGIVKTFRLKKSFSMTRISKIIKTFPRIKEYRELVKWRDENKKIEPVNIKDINSYEENFAFLSQIKEKAKKLSDSCKEILFFDVIVHLASFGKNMYYESCPSDNCYKKIKFIKEGEYHCPKCDKVYDNYKIKYFCNISFEDSTGSIYAISAREDQCQLFFGRPIEDIKRLIDESESDFFYFLKMKQFREFKLKIYVKKEFYNERADVRYYISKAEKIEGKEQQFTKKLLELVKK